jgi:hypothetical protein
MRAKLVQSYRNTVSVANQIHTQLNQHAIIWLNYYNQYNLARYADIIELPIFRWMSIRDLSHDTNVSTDDEDNYLTRMSCLHAEGRYMPDNDLSQNIATANDDEIIFLTRMSHLHSYCYMKD